MEHSEINDIIRILSGEKNQLAKLLCVSEEKKTLIINNDIAGLDQVLKDEETMITGLRDLEDERMSLVSSLAARLGIKERELTLTYLAGLTHKPEYKHRITALHHDLSELIKKQKRCNGIVKALIERKKGFIGDMLGLLLQTEPSVGIYDNCGSAKARYTEAALFDQSV